MAGLGYFKAIKTHTCSAEEEKQQKIIVRAILSEKGFPEKLLNELEHHKNPIEKEKPKQFIGITKFDNISKRDKFVKQICKKSILDKNKFYLPADTPGKKLEQYIFTIRKMKSKIKF